MRNVILFKDRLFNFESSLSSIKFMSWKWMRLSSKSIFFFFNYYDWYTSPLNCLRKSIFSCLFGIWVPLVLSYFDIISLLKKNYQPIKIKLHELTKLSFHYKLFILRKMHLSRQVMFTFSIPTSYYNMSCVQFQ